MIWDILWVVGALAVAFALFALAVYLRVMWPTVMKSGNGAKKIACVGDSITYGFGVLGRRKNWAFPAIIAKRIGDDYTVINYGLSDRTLLSTADRPYFKEKIGKEAWETDAQTVIFMLGTNDCKRSNWNGEQFKKEYAECIRHYVAANKQLYVVIPP